jgi:glycosyltransferase involved in cell wall biosynthesis
MRILHCCLAAFYIDNYGYQENILPKMHKLQGHEVSILASTETYIDNSSLGYVDSGTYYSCDGISVTRIPYSKILPRVIMKKLRIYIGVKEFIEKFEPDVIFLHDCQFLSIVQVAKYKVKHPNVRIYVDGHTDFINSARGLLSKHLLHGIIYRWCAKVIEPYTKKFYGVLPIRTKFFHDMYGIDSRKIETLPLGVDDSVIDFNNTNVIRKMIRDRLEISDSDFVIVTGGKIDTRKNIHLLMRAFSGLDIDNIKLIVFGTANLEMREEIDSLSHHKNIINIGWVSSESVYDYFMASDLAFFPGTHSVLWEQAIGTGLPCVFRRWPGIQHVDVGGNCMFINEGTIEAIEDAIKNVIFKRELFDSMKKVAIEKGRSEFSYYEIAKRAIEN